MACTKASDENLWPATESDYKACSSKAALFRSSKPSQAKPSQAKPSQGVNWGGVLRQAQVDVPVSVSHSCV